MDGTNHSTISYLEETQFFSKKCKTLAQNGKDGYFKKKHKWIRNFLSQRPIEFRTVDKILLYPIAAEF